MISLEMSGSDLFLLLAVVLPSFEQPLITYQCISTSLTHIKSCLLLDMYNILCTNYQIPIGQL